jgi:acetyl esterase/lipase
MRNYLVAAVVLASSALAVEQNDVEFARPGGVSLTLDLKTLEGNGPFPAAIIVHGGSFSHGHKRTYVTPLFDVLSNAGFAWFTINYRLAPDYQFPAAVEDVESAVRWVKDNAAKYHVDARRIALIGESAGGYLVAYAGAHPEPGADVAAVVDFYGPNDLVLQTEKRRSQADNPTKPHDPGLMEFLGFKSWHDAGVVEKLRAVSPTTLISKQMPPFLFIHGNDDEQVPYEQSPNMCEAMRKAGAKCEVITVQGGRHGMMSWEKVPGAAHWKSDMAAWLKRTLGN